MSAILQRVPACLYTIGCLTSPVATRDVRHKELHDISIVWPC